MGEIDPLWLRGVLVGVVLGHVLGAVWAGLAVGSGWLLWAS